MKRYILILIYLLFHTCLLSQDIVYDSIAGNKSNWFRSRGGPTELLLKTEYENDALLIRSKVLAAAGLLSGMERGVDYQDYSLSYDTMTYEFSTDVPINVIIYKYCINDTTCNFFVGIRKATLGDNMLDGKYLFISPLIVLNSEVKVFDGIGVNRSLLASLKPSELTDLDVGDNMLSSQVTIQGINVSRILRKAKTRGILTGIEEIRSIDIVYGPVPAKDKFNIEFDRILDVTIRVFNNSPTLIYQEKTTSNIINLNTSSWSSGLYLISISDSNTNIILKVIKLIKY